MNMDGNETLLCSYIVMNKNWVRPDKYVKILTKYQAN